MDVYRHEKIKGTAGMPLSKIEAFDEPYYRANTWKSTLVNDQNAS